MPTVANYAYRRARCVEDDMMRIYQADFSYFTGPNSFYPEKIIKGEPPNIKTRPKKQPVMIEGTGSRRRRKTRSCNARVCWRVWNRRKKGNDRSKTKELTCTLPSALSMCPTTTTGSSEEREDVTTACLVVHANVAQRDTAVSVQTIYKKNDIVAVKQNHRRERAHLSG